MITPFTADAGQVDTQAHEAYVKVRPGLTRAQDCTMPLRNMDPLKHAKFKCSSLHGLTSTFQLAGLDATQHACMTMERP